MPPTKRPGPKSFQQQAKLLEKSPKRTKYPIADLGDTDASTTSSSALDGNESGEVTDDEGFRSPPPDTEGTDYGLEFTATGTRFLAHSSKEGQSLAPPNQLTKPIQTPVESKKQTRKSISKIIAPTSKDTGGSSTPVSTPNSALPVNNENSAKIAKPTKTTMGASKRTMLKQQKQRDLQFLKSYKKLASRVDYMIPRAAFGRLVREIMSNLGTDVQYITATALEALQTATEAYVQGRLEDANLLALHARRVTLMAKDMELINFLRINQR